MSIDIEESVVGDADRPDMAHGRVLAFVSPKGGTGKTVIAATTAYLLLKSGKRVLTIDADFSTRGISLFLLGDILKSENLYIRPEQCLADAVLANMEPQNVKPLSIFRYNTAFNVILSNTEVWRGGVPDEAFLKPSDRDADGLVNRYFRFLDELCASLKRQYDYVIIDTRGGYDFTSAVPAIISDGYIVVIEADRLSLDQVHGFKTSLDKFADNFKRRAVLEGFFVNKAMFSVDENIFPDSLARLYESNTFGTIPLDPDVMRAYQLKELPTKKYPESDFAYYSLKAVERLVSPELNWPQEDQNRFRQAGQEVHRMWAGRMRGERLRKLVPVLQSFLLFVSLVSYVIYTNDESSWALKAFCLSTGLFAVAAVPEALYRMSKVAGADRLKRPTRLAIGAALASYFCLFALIVTFSLPRVIDRKEEKILKLANDLKDYEEREKLNKTLLVAASNIADPFSRSQAYAAVSDAATKVGQLQLATEAASKITQPFSQSQAYSAVAEAAVKNPDHAASLLKSAMEAASQITNPEQQSQAYSAVARAATLVGQFPLAMEMAAKLMDPYSQYLAYSMVAEVAVKDSDRTGSALTYVMGEFSKIPDSLLQSRVFAAVAEAVAKNPNRAGSAVRLAMEAATKIRDPLYQPRAYAAVAEAATKSGQLQLASDAASKIMDPELQIWAYTAVAEAAAKDPDRSAASLQSAMVAASMIRDPIFRSQAYTKVARLANKAGLTGIATEAEKNISAAPKN